MSPKPHVEIAAVIPDAEGRIVIGKKKGLYELPGGNLKMGEEIFACVEREALDEAGLKVKGKKVIAYTNDVQKDEFKHEVTLYVLCEREDPSQQPQVKEGEKYESWEWKSWKDIVALGESQLFLQTLNLTKAEPELDSKFS